MSAERAAFAEEQKGQSFSCRWAEDGKGAETNSRKSGTYATVVEIQPKSLLLLLRFEIHFWLIFSVEHMFYRINNTF